MNKLLFRVIVLSAALCIFALPQSARADITDGLISYWPLDEGTGATTADAGGVNTFDGTLQGSPTWVSGMSGKFGNALEFNGTDQYVECATRVGDGPGTYPAELMPVSFSTSCWTKLANFAYFSSFVGNGMDSGSDECGFFMYNYGWNGDNDSDFGLALRTVSGGEYYLESANIYETDTWYHVVATYDSSTSVATLYVNGSDAGVDSDGSTDGDVLWVSPTSGNYPERFAIGVWLDPTYALYVDGTIDDVGYWDRALTPDEITWLYNGGEGNPILTNLEIAWNSDPSNGQLAIPLDKTLSWKTGLDPDTELVNTAITDHDLYMSPGKVTDPNVYFVATIPVVGNDPNGRYPATPGGDWLDRDTTYYWRVNEVTGSGDIIGQLWMFETLLSIPVIDAATPADVLVDLNGNVDFTVSVTNPFTGNSTGMTYEWYKEGTPDTLVGTGPALNINPALLSDIGYYYCKVTITSTSGTADSRSARLEIKRKVAHWTFDVADGLTDTAPAPGGIYDGAALGVPGPAYTTNVLAGIPSDQALSLDGSEPNLVVVVPPLDLRSNTVTITAWVKTNGTPDSWDGIVHSRGSTTHGINFTGNDQLGYHWNDNNWDWNSGLVVPDAEWAFVAVVIEPTQATLYLNGDSSTNVVAHNDAAFDIETQIGRDASIWETRIVNGDIDDVRVYNYSLAPIDVAGLFIDGKPDETVCFGGNPPYDFNGDCTTNLLDFVEFALQWADCNIVPDCLP